MKKKIAQVSHEYNRTTEFTGEESVSQTNAKLNSISITLAKN